MHPVLFSIGGLSISSFGFFISLSFLLSLFVIWRLCLLYDIDEEKTLDLSLLTFFGALIGARIFHVALNFSQYDTLSKMAFINRYPGLNFWGGLILGGLTLRFLVRRLKLSFWQIADFVMVGVFLGLSTGSIGCLLSSCQSGFPSNLPIAVTQIGLLGPRFPIQAVQSLLFFLGFIYLWKAAIRFHFAGKILSLGLILLGLIVLVIEPFRSDVVRGFSIFSLGQVLSIVTILFGKTLFYRLSKRSFKADLRFLMGIVTGKTRGVALSRLRKNWYNLKVNTRVSWNRSIKSVLGYKKVIRKNLNVKPNPPEFHQH
jgi:phosphatidylglycerol---prolipoprotein diacylglyceryl transferase